MNILYPFFSTLVKPIKTRTYSCFHSTAGSRRGLYGFSSVPSTCRVPKTCEKPYYGPITDFFWKRHVSNLTKLTWVEFNQMDRISRANISEKLVLSRKLLFTSPSHNQSDGSHVLYGLIIANTSVFLAWNTYDTAFMEKNFMVSYTNVVSGRWHTLVTSSFSHKSFGHLFTNMICLYFFGGELCRIFGGPFLAGLYLLGGVGGSISHLVYYKYLYPEIEKLKGQWWITSSSRPALGASTAVNSITMLSCLTFPARIIYVNFIIPVPAIVLGMGYVVYDLYGASSSGSTVGHAGHLGGVLVGFLTWIFLRFR